MTLAPVPAIRPGVEVNGQRITAVTLCNDEMTLSWAGGVKAAAVRQLEAAYPELVSGLHLPKLARVIAPSEAVAEGSVSDAFRPRYAVRVQLLDADGNPDGSTPEYPAVPLPVPMAGQGAGLFHFPPPGTLVEIAFTGGRPDKPFIRQILAQGLSLPAVQPGEQLQQQREGVFQRVTVHGDWVRQTDQTICESSMTRRVSADEDIRQLVTRKTEIRATDSTTVMGTASLVAGAVRHLTTGDYVVASQRNLLSTADGDTTLITGGSQHSTVTGSVALEAGGSLTEQIQGLRRSVAASQQIIGATVHLGNGEINVLSMLLETIDLLGKLAACCAEHQHPDTAGPVNADAFSEIQRESSAAKEKYQSVIS